MKHDQKNIRLTALPLLAVLALAGCGILDGIGSLAESPDAVVRKTGPITIVNATPDSITHYLLGRDYAASGRYELAREEYLLALAASNNPEMQQSLTLELDSINMMIKSLR
ncbi:MAG: hypothetical protein LBM00_03510 [Deltaproteobacteria bacterium]|jgi:hypothetical protein|nr:hypothetical protein [Deltaproteobacteria bacterium]